MDQKEAIAWLSGDRSTCNTFYQAGMATETSELLTIQADAAMTQQAYWVLRAHKEGLIPPQPKLEKE